MVEADPNPIPPKCFRPGCQHPISHEHRPYCGDDHENVAAAIRRLPSTVSQSSMMTFTAESSVADVREGKLGWLDVRAAS